MTLRTDPVTINFGPHHPSTHGVFQMRITADGEVITNLEPVMGYLHRGCEKLSEGRTYTQVVPLTDRLDYLSPMSNNVACVLAAERLGDIPVPERAEYIRVIMAELQRLANHCAMTGFLLNDLGTFFTLFHYTMREREKILDLFEMTCGTRVTVSYMRPGGVLQDLPEEFLPRLRALLDEMPHRIDDYEALITQNEIVLARTKGVGVMSKELAIAAGCSGPMLRGSGVKWDIRKNDTYSIYDRFQFDIPVGTNGDVYDRYWVRIQEMRQSLRILEQAYRDIPQGEVRTRLPLFFRLPSGEAYGRIEAPKGELGFYLVSDGGIAPYRMHVRAPSFINLGVLRDLTVGYTVADAVITLGSVDIVLGEVDR